MKSAAQRRFAVPAVPSTFLDAEVLQDALAVGKLLGDETCGSEHGEAAVLELRDEKSDLKAFKGLETGCSESVFPTIKNNAENQLTSLVCISSNSSGSSGRRPRGSKFMSPGM